jgi:hypothetical protein
MGATFITPDHLLSDAQMLAAEGWQAILLSDLPTEPLANASQSIPLSAATAQTLDQYVRQTGGGLLILSQGHAFGPGHYGEGSAAGDLLEQLSPLASHPPVGGKRHVIFVLDASASMNQAAPSSVAAEKRFALLTRAVEEAATFLGTADRVTVITFNRQSQLVAEEHGGTSGAAAIRQKLATIQPMGATTPDTALPDVAKALEQPAKNLVLFITDGEIPSMDIPLWKAALTRQPDTRLIIMAPAPPAPSADTPAALSTLAQLTAALPGSSWLQTSDPTGWAQILKHAVAAEVRGQVESSPPFTPLTWRVADDPALPLQTATSWTRTWLKPESLPLARPVSDPDLPVAAAAQRGLGKVGAITIFDDNSPGYQKLLESALQAVAASPGDRRFSLSLGRASSGEWLVSADGKSEQGFLNGLSLKLTTLDAPDSLPMLQTGPGHYEARLAAPHGLSAVVTRQESAATGVKMLVVGRVQSPAVEAQEWPATMDPSPAEQLLPAGAVQLSGSLDDGAQWNIPLTGRTALSNGFWIFAATFALVALWMRR